MHLVLQNNSIEFLIALPLYLFSSWFTFYYFSLHDLWFTKVINYFSPSFLAYDVDIAYGKNMS
jgi:hypothetical protein